MDIIPQENALQLITMFQLIITALAAVGASSGFWIFMDRKRNNRDAMNRLLIGIAHDRIVFLSLKYIERGCITQDEHENLIEFLYTPYKELGGNGSAVRLMEEINKLQIVNARNFDFSQIRKEKDVSCI